MVNLASLLGPLSDSTRSKFEDWAYEMAFDLAMADLYRARYATKPPPPRAYIHAIADVCRALAAELRRRQGHVARIASVIAPGIA